MTRRQRHLVVCDDEPSIRQSLCDIFEDEGYQVTACDSGESLLNWASAEERRCHAIFLDIWLPGISGIETLKELRRRGVQCPVIAISGHASTDQAVEAVRLGAYDFLEKPLNLDRLLVTLNNALDHSDLHQRRRELESRLPQMSLIGESPQIQKVKALIQRAAPTPGRVLLLGESGVGKEVAARAIHELSVRSKEPFVEVNCAAIPDDLIESELFGHMKGSFTGASESREGKFEQADGGTLFLDEIGDMGVQTQAKVLRVLQDQSFMRVGGSKRIEVDVRIVAATNKDLEEEIKSNRFRQDLYFRLNVVPITIPPLRERQEDLPLLTAFFSRQFAESYGRAPLIFPEETMRLLQAHPWPGNVRELKNLVERLFIVCGSKEVQPEDLPVEFSGLPTPEPLLRAFESLREAKEHFEKNYLEFMLQRHGYNVTRTAEALQIERSHLHKKIKRFGLEAKSMGSSP